VDVGQTITRMPVGVGRTPCIIPRSNLWMRRNFRMVESPEALRLQGLIGLDLSRLGEFSDAELFDLAGNAFCGTNCLAILLAALHGANI
jgi:hypothetical protein